MKLFTGCKNYTIIKSEELKDINAVGYVLVHDKTGARVALVQNDDDNKAFVIGFKTPQDNSTGVPHILEHSVLCGSRKYPVKDAMTEVCKGSLNTFINAFTYSDRTLYPVASYNDKDFQNLMSVYLDAVFYPRVYNEPKIFKQEGWHYEIDSKDGDITYNGVVYNEMKGVYSSPQSALGSYDLFSLFPDTQYGVESGGDPDHIPELSYEDFISFHKKLYNPSNSRIFLYGDMDFEEKLEFIDREYLSHFDRVETDSEVLIQKPFDKPVYVEKEYPVADSESTEDATLLSYNFVVSDYTDILTTEAMNAIDYALVSAPGSVLERKLLDAGIGTNNYADYVTDTCQKVYSIVAQDANPEDRDRFVAIIEETLAEIVRDGFNKKTLEAAITTSEFSYREADFGYYPKGIAYALMTFDDWTYSDENVFSNLKVSSVFDELRKGIDEGLFEKIIKERFIENNHKSVVVLKPKRGLQKEKDDALREKLKAFKDSLSEEQIEKLIKETAELKEYQEAEDSEEALKTIPTLSLSDIDKKAKPVDYSISKIGKATQLYTELPTNGIAYLMLSFSMDSVPFRLLPAVSTLKGILGMVDTLKRTYSDLSDEVNILSGGIVFTTSNYKSIVDSDRYSVTFEIRTKALYKNVGLVADIIKEILFESKLKDKKRIKELIDMSVTKQEGYMIESGHAVALNRAVSYFSRTAMISEILNGVDKYNNDKALSESFDERFEALINDINEVISIIFTKDNLKIALACEQGAKAEVEKVLLHFVDSLGDSQSLEKAVYPEPTMRNEGLSCASQVQYVALAGNYKNSGLGNTSRLGILRNILSNDFLWNAVRLQGGAYGVMCGFSKTGESYFVSYRDPNLLSTLEAYRNAAEYIRNYPDDAETVERYIITTIGDMDSPISSSMKLARAFNYYMMDVTNESVQTDRNQILSTTVSDVRDLYKYIEAVCKTGALCTVGGEEMLEKEGNVFNVVKPLFA